VRYADDIFCVINRRKVSTLLSLLSSQNPSIKFTCEEEVDGSLPFLDVRVTRRDSILKFDEENLPTLSGVSLSLHVIQWNTKWLSSTPCCTGLLTFPFQGRISKKKWHTSRRQQDSMETTIAGFMSKHLFKRKIKELTTLSPISKEATTKRAGLTLHPCLSRKISNIMAKHDIQMVPKASGKLSQVLGSPKYVVDERAKSDIYEIQCQTWTDETEH
jgi:hypothetical protein